MTLAQTYARALYETEGTTGTANRAALFGNFVAALKRRGHGKLLPRIEKEYAKLVAQGKKNIVHIRIAREKDRAAAQKSVAALSKKGEPAAKTVVDTALVSGFMVSGRDFRFDATGRRALLQLYKKLTAAH